VSRYWVGGLELGKVIGSKKLIDVKILGQRIGSTSRKNDYMINSILEWMNFDDEESSSIECGPNSSGGKCHVNIHVSATSDGTNYRGHMGATWL